MPNAKQILGAKENRTWGSIKKNLTKAGYSIDKITKHKYGTSKIIKHPQGTYRVAFNTKERLLSNSKLLWFKDKQGKGFATIQNFKYQ